MRRSADDPPQQTSQQATDHGRASRPPSGEAVDIACPECGKRPIQGLTKVRTVTGLVLAWRRRTGELPACEPCMKRAHRSAFLGNLFKGWWAPHAFVANLFFFLPQSLFRWLSPPKMNGNLFEHLDDRLISYRISSPQEPFDPSEHAIGELHTQPIAKLGLVVALSDGDLSKAEMQQIYDDLTALSPDFPRSRLVELAREQHEAPVAIERLCTSIAETMTEEGRQLAFKVGVDAAAADGRIQEREVQTLWDAARALNLGQAHVEQVLAERASLDEAVRGVADQT